MVENKLLPDDKRVCKLFNKQFSESINCILPGSSYKQLNWDEKKAFLDCVFLLNRMIEMIDHYSSNSSWPWVECPKGPCCSGNQLKTNSNEIRKRCFFEPPTPPFFFSKDQLLPQLMHLGLPDNANFWKDQFVLKIFLLRLGKLKHNANSFYFIRIEFSGTWKTVLEKRNTFFWLWIKWFKWSMLFK